MVNTADDLVLHGLHISPDLDTVLYTLSGLANPETGWGVRGDTFSGLEMLARLGGPAWFRLGDRDLALHITRTSLLRDGDTLTQATAQIWPRRSAITAQLVPMCDERVETIIETPDGAAGFPGVFRASPGCRDEVRGIRFQGIEIARPTFALQAALEQAAAIVFCPSNPLVSIGPILAVPGVRQAIIRSRRARGGGQPDHRRAGRARPRRPHVAGAGT